jgi:hypothetical protein
MCVGHDRIRVQGQIETAKRRFGCPGYLQRKQSHLVRSPYFRPQKQGEGYEADSLSCHPNLSIGLDRFTPNGVHFFLHFLLVPLF